MHHDPAHDPADTFDLARHLISDEDLTHLALATEAAELTLRGPVDPLAAEVDHLRAPGRGGRTRAAGGARAAGGGVARPEMRTAPPTRGWRGCGSRIRQTPARVGGRERRGDQPAGFGSTAGASVKST